MRLTKKEQAVVQLMADNVGTQYSLSQIADIYYGSKPRPKHWRTQIAAFMRRIEMKTKILYHEGVQLNLVYRTSPMGRGNHAKYVCN